MSALTPHNAQFVIIAFEGPDEYSRAGGLAVRVRDLAETLSAAGFETHLFFIGDPNLPPVEQHGSLTLHRWSQWISAHHPGGVYDGELGKAEDLAYSLPPVLAETVVLPAAQAGRLTVIMGEDWQTAPTMIRIAQTLAVRDLFRWVVPVWTANNLYGFEGINWAWLREAATPLTVSRYMKHEMRHYGVDPLVTYNGVSPSAIVTAPAADTKRIRAAFSSKIALFKIGRFSPDKNWLMALQAVALQKYHGTRARILVRGDRLPYGHDVLAQAHGYGLHVADLPHRYNSATELATAIAAHPEADVLNLTAFLPDSLLPPIYAAVDGVLANSSHEPFGLVGLEVMGAGGLAIVGSTGEEYAVPDQNAVVLDTDDPREIMYRLRRLTSDPTMIRRMKKAARATARAWTWPAVSRDLLLKLEYVALTRGVEGMQ